MRHYDLANRNRNQFTGIVDFVPSDRVDLQRVRRRRQGQLPGQLLRAAGDDVQHRVVRRRLPPAERPRRRRQLQLRNVLRPPALAIGQPGPGERPDSGLDDRHGRDGELLLDLRHAAENRTKTPRRGCRTTSATRKGAICTRSSPAGRCRRPRSCRMSTTSCSSCTWTSGTGCRIDWRCRSRICTNRSACTISRSTRPSSTASFSPVRWCSAMSTGRTPRTPGTIGLRYFW